MDISKFTTTQTGQIKSNTKPKSSGNSVGGSVLGYFAATLISGEIQEPIRRFARKTERGLNNDLSKDDITLLNNEVDKLFKDSKLAKKGAILQKLNKDNPNLVAETKELLKASIFKPIKLIIKATGKKNSEKIYNSMAKFAVADITERKNSYFAIKKNLLLADGERYGLNIFGTLGNAMNKKIGTISKAVRKMSLAKYLFGPILLISVISRNKTAQNNETLSKKDKFTNLVRNNAGKLGMLAMTPFIASEGIAAFKAHRLIKKTALTENIKNSAIAVNAWKPTKPIIHALIAGLALFSAVQTKNYFQTRKDNKTSQPV